MLFRVSRQLLMLAMKIFSILLPRLHSTWRVLFSLLLLLRITTNLLMVVMALLLRMASAKLVIANFLL